MLVTFIKINSLLLSLIINFDLDYLHLIYCYIPLGAILKTIASICVIVEKILNVSKLKM